MMAPINYARIQAIREYCEEHDEDPTDTDLVKHLIKEGMIP